MRLSLEDKAKSKNRQTLYRTGKCRNRSHRYECGNTGDRLRCHRKICSGKHIDMVVVGPEDPLVKGIYDYFVSCEELKTYLL